MIICLLNSKLLVQIRDANHIKPYSYSTGKTHLYWTKRLILFHDKHHPAEIAVTEIVATLT